MVLEIWQVMNTRNENAVHVLGQTVHFKEYSCIVWAYDTILSKWNTNISNTVNTSQITFQEHRVCTMNWGKYNAGNSMTRLLTSDHWN